MKKLLLLFLLAPSGLFAQGMRYDNFVLKPLPAGGVTPVSGALITVCTSGGTGQPCTPKVANIYSDEALLTPIVGTGGSGTTNSDANGNFGFYLAPGSYIITVTGTGFTSYTIKLVLPSGLTTTAPYTGTQTFLGQVLCKDIEAVKCVDSANSQGWSGSDVGGWLNSAYAALPSSGGTIYLFNLGSTCMAYSTPIVFATLNKNLQLEGFGGTNTTPTGGACLNYTPTTATNAITIDYTNNGALQPASNGIRNLTLINNGCTTTGGCGSSAQGIVLGTTNGGMQSGTLQNVSVSGFIVGFLDSNFPSIGVTVLDSVFTGNQVAIQLGNVNGVNIVNGVYSGNGVTLMTTSVNGAEVYMTNPQVFGPSGPMFDFTRSTASNAKLTCVGCHLESAVGQAGNQHLVEGRVDARFFGGVIEDDSSTNTNDCMICLTNSNLVTEGVQFFSSRAVTQLVSLTTSRAVIGGINGSPSNITTITNSSNANVLMQALNGGTIVPWVFESPFSLIELAAPQGGTAARSIISSSSDDHFLHYNPNNAGVQQVPQVIATTSAYTNATTGFTTVTGGNTLQFPVAANRTYSVNCQIVWQGSASTTGPKFQFTGPAAPTAVAFSLDSAVTATSTIMASVTAFSSALANTGTVTATTNFPAQVSGTVVNGANSGTVVLQAAANGAGTLTIQPGSYCRFQ